MRGVLELFRNLKIQLAEAKDAPQVKFFLTFSCFALYGFLSQLSAIISYSEMSGVGVPPEPVQARN